MNSGAIHNKIGATEITNATFFQNTATNHGGALGVATAANSVRVSNSLFADNSASGGATCAFTGFTNLVTTLANLATDSSCGSGFGVKTSQQLALGAPGAFGGATYTIPLLPGSAAIDAADSAKLPATDQRGVRRPQGARGDVGAYEFEGVREVPEADTLLLMSGGLGGLATWLRWRWARRARRKDA